MGKRTKKRYKKMVVGKCPVRKDVYEMEKVVGHSWADDTSLATGIIFYDIKWLGWPSSDNTSQLTRDFESTHLVSEYWRQLIRTAKASAKETAIAKATIVAHEWQKGQFLFRNDDGCLLTTPAPADKRIVKGFERDESGDDNIDFNETLELYQQQVNLLALFCRNHPYINVQNTVDNALPIPIDKLLFRMEPKRFSPPKPETRRHGLVEPTPIFTDKNKFTLSMASFVERRRYFQERMNSLDPYSASADLTKVMNGHTKIDKDSTIRPMDNHDQRVMLNLQRTGETHWELSPTSCIPEGKTVMLLTGELCTPEDAEKSMKKHGEIHALSNYIQLSDTVCLDTSKRHGFDKYLQHSCDPNCYVDISFPYRDPKAPPLATIRAKMDIGENDVLTVDWFEGFGRIDTAPNYRDGPTLRDHVACICNEKKCRSILWLETIDDNEKYIKIKKKTRLQRHTRPFQGLPLPRHNLDDR